MGDRTEPAIDDPMEVWLEVTRALMKVDRAMAPDVAAKVAIEAVWRCGWRPAPLVELMMETPDERVLLFDGTSHGPP